MRIQCAKGALSGLISGTFLGLFLKMIEYASGVKVYTLLLNVDYIPILKDYHFPEAIEFAYHLIISVVLAVSLILLIKKYRWNRLQIIVRTLLITFSIGVLLYPTTALSDRTPEITSIYAIVFWLSGHLLYGLLLSIFFIKSH
ncbi:hypothetical protein AF332_05930 [Sporosarcina globispora]|uniref:Uncharacterized protein n=1 Tax=Sporosarcina globispora TaxID=1459 RepID=A0A0M0G983_SPOGL|nr:hypothetical protein [Sporosarcina globispora]KON86404.1 hypothetical protein AF332_05930 [Sporosarcina globispora]